MCAVRPGRVPAVAGASLGLDEREAY